MVATAVEERVEVVVGGGKIVPLLENLAVVVVVVPLVWVLRGAVHRQNQVPMPTEVANTRVVLHCHTIYTIDPPPAACDAVPGV